MRPAVWRPGLLSLALLLPGCAAPPRGLEPVALPRGCDDTVPGHRVIRSFWTTLDSGYAVFDRRLRGRDWASIGAEACAAVDGSTPPTALFERLVAMARTLDDGHIQITAPELARRETGWATGYAPGPLMARLEATVERRYADGPLTRAANGRMAWGRIGPVGYLNLAAFEELDSIGGEAGDVAAARAAMARVASDLRTADGIIVDLRNNEGGWDAVGLEVARWFRGPRTLSYTKARRAGPRHDQFGPWEEVHVAASPPEALRGPVVVMLSGWTFSAAETFALSMRARPGVTLLGETTSGHFSDLQPARLPNGWRFTYSAERYRAPDGTVYEGRGVPVTIKVPFDSVALAAGRDPILEAALAAVAGR